MLIVEETRNNVSHKNILSLKVDFKARLILKINRKEYVAFYFTSKTSSLGFAL